MSRIGSGEFAEQPVEGAALMSDHSIQASHPLIPQIHDRIDCLAQLITHRPDCSGLAGATMLRSRNYCGGRKPNVWLTDD